MNLVAIVRALNEEDNIARFCYAYSWADKILVADGGSRDRTIEIAQSFPNVEVREFFTRMPLPNGDFYNHEGAHSQFLLEWSKAYQPDWLFFDDCDSTPSKSLQRDIRNILQTWTYPAIFVRRFYLWYTPNQYLPKFDVGASMYGWKPRELEVEADQNEPLHPRLFCDAERRTNYQDLPFDKEFEWYLHDPYRLIHRTYRSEAQIQAKLKRYELQGRPQVYPLINYGPPEDLPIWALSEI